MSVEPVEQVVAAPGLTLKLTSCSGSFFFVSNSVQSPVLGESVSMCSPSDHNPNFYKDLMVKSCDAELGIHQYE